MTGVRRSQRTRRITPQSTGPIWSAKKWNKRKRTRYLNVRKRVKRRSVFFFFFKPFRNMALSYKLSCTLSELRTDFRRRLPQADRGAFRAISVDDLARDNVAGHREASCESRAILERLVLRVVNHDTGVLSALLTRFITP